MGCGQFLLGALFWGTVLYLFGKVMANQGTRLDELICLGIAILFGVLAFLGAKDMF